MPLLREAEQSASLTGQVALCLAARRILLVVDCAPAADTIKTWIESSTGSLVGAEVVLLALMPQPDVVRTRAIFIDTVRHHLRDDGAVRLLPLQTMLERSGIACVNVVVIADGAGAVVQTAKERRCDLIVTTVATPSRSRKQWMTLTGTGLSVAAQVTDLASCPVLVLKYGRQ